MTATLNRMPGRAAAVAAFSSLLVACSSGADPENASATSTTDGGDEITPEAGPSAPDIDFSAFDQALEAFLTDNSLPGATAAVVHAEYGLVHSRGYGAFDTDRLILIASSSKILSVGIFMRLMDTGALDIDAPLGNVVGDWGDQKADVTVAQLVSNSSGLTSLTDNPLYPPYICQYVPTGTLTECAQTIYTADDAADRIAPDTEFHYGGGPWQLAGGVAEVASGKAWAELVTETYVEPCGATTLGYTNQFAQAFSAGGNVGSALGYPQFFQADPANLQATENPSVEGGAYVTAADYGAILLMHLRGGLCNETRVLSEEAVERMREDRILEAYNGSTTSQTLAGYGLGWWIDRAHPGVFVDGGAYGAMPFIDLNRGYGAILLIEANTGIGESLRLATQPVLEGIFDGLAE